MKKICKRVRWKKINYLHRASGPGSWWHLWQVRRSRSNQGQMPRCWHRMSQHAARTVLESMPTAPTHRLSRATVSCALSRSIIPHPRPPGTSSSSPPAYAGSRRVHAFRLCTVTVIARSACRQRSPLSVTPEMTSAITSPFSCTWKFVHGS